ncbi:DndE family protein [Mucilaginibacter jinjuensis]|uniref:DndE family protein n=1 Tax=Mucilaginibacter jinjuensis TaxID=1176721 RepID=A0ABY7TAL0_9SPHI|nr:DndE family protein [Mucilaginibacter jinjuensis]WCT13471.1 DndE family protein [Mucilaginibacter jinjuensis]
MFSNIKTSKSNKELVSRLTSKLNLGTENLIARISMAHSLGLDRRLELANIADAGGKEYSFKVLFGDNYDYYIALICVHYNLYKTDKDIPRYVKMHIDDGLELLDKEFSTTLGIDSLVSIIDKGLSVYA